MNTKSEGYAKQLFIKPEGKKFQFWPANEVNYAHFPAKRKLARPISPSSQRQQLVDKQSKVIMFKIRIVVEQLCNRTERIWSNSFAVEMVLFGDREYV